MSGLRRAPAGAANEALLRIVRRHGCLRLDEPIELASGQRSRDFVDVKLALAEGRDLELACRVLLNATDELGVPYDAVGGMTMGADALAHVCATLAGRRWFVVRKAPKGRGTNKRVEGSALGPGMRVLLVEDAVTTGTSMLEAYRVVADAGAQVSAALTVVDRGDAAALAFARLGIPYRALLSYADLGIEPIRA